MRGWHFVEVDEDGTPRLGYGDGRAVVAGETLTVDCEPVLCKAGLHASGDIMDALRYAPRVSRLSLCRVTLGGTVVKGEDKAAGTERRCDWMLDADATERLLREFARWCALEVAHLWEMPDVVREYLETGDESKRAAARDAAWAAADAAAWAARDAARAARPARDAAWAAAWASRAAAWDAVWDAAWAAAWAAADAAAWAAAWAAADAAAWAAVRPARDAGPAVWDAFIERATAELERRALTAREIGGRDE